MPNEEEAQHVLFKTSCDSCGSSDANAHYSGGTAYCFSCGKHTFTEPRASKPTNKPKSKSMSRDVLLMGDYMPLKARGIPEEICKQYNYKVGTNKGERVQIATYYDKDKQPIAQ